MNEPQDSNNLLKQPLEPADQIMLAVSWLWAVLYILMLIFKSFLPQMPFFDYLKKKAALDIRIKEYIFHAGKKMKSHLVDGIALVWGYFLSLSAQTSLISLASQDSNHIPLRLPTFGIWPQHSLCSFGVRGRQCSYCLSWWSISRLELGVESSGRHFHIRSHFLPSGTMRPAGTDETETVIGH